MSRFLEALRSGHVLLMDGAMGTELQRAGLKQGECGEHWNLTHPDVVREIHQAYQRAGAECFLTNTFQSNLTNLRKHGLECKLEAINQAALALAQSVAGRAGFVLGDTGPIISNFDETEFMSISRLARSLASADALLYETWSNCRAFLAILPTFDLPSLGTSILISLTFHKDTTKGPVTYDGHSPQFCARSIDETPGVQALGVNCGRDIGMNEIIEIIRSYRQETDLPLFARPNAGTPIRVGDRWIYPRTPEEMAGRLPELLKAGVSMIGGCCGTTPEHIAAFRPIVDKWNAERTPRHQSSDRQRGLD